MKLLRVCLLVLLAALLPIRGAMAAAMLCPPAGVGAHTEMRLMGHEQAGHDHIGESHAHHQHEDGEQHDHGMSSEDKCNLCSAFCSLTPMLSEIVGIEEPRDFIDASFPVLSVPAPSFLSDGEERPPRSI